MFFVLSAGRSGSRTSSTVFSQFDNCACLHHPEPELVVEATQYLYGERSAEELAEQLRTTRPQANEGEVYGEVNLQMTLLFPIIRQVFPDAKFIWLIRDGRDSVASMFYRGWYDDSNEQVPAYWHRARLQADKTGDMSTEQWQSLDRFSKCCWIWLKYNLLIESHLSQTDQAMWRKLRLEEMRASLPAIATFLGLKSQQRVRVEKTNRAVQPVVAWHKWDADQRQVICLDLRVGYGSLVLRLEITQRGLAADCPGNS